MLKPTNSRMPASTLIGMLTASGASSSMNTSSVSACTTPAMGEWAPLRMLVTVRAMVPVTAMPPNSGVAKLAMPWAISSWLGSWRSWVMPSATRAHSSDSMAPRKATASVGPSRFWADSQSKLGSTGAGRLCGMPPKRLPMVSTGSCSAQVNSVPSSSTTSGAGMRHRMRRSRLACGATGAAGVADVVPAVVGAGVPSASPASLAAVPTTPCAGCSSAV